MRVMLSGHEFGMKLERFLKRGKKAGETCGNDCLNRENSVFIFQKLFMRKWRKIPFWEIKQTERSLKF